jgi:excisionase family DNA binding protein
MSLKGAAEALGVHEQTLRAWEKRGLIRLVRLPGSRYRRVPRDEIARLRREMLDQNGPGGVVIVAPQSDPESLALAEELAAIVREEVAALETTTTLDEWMASRRGRA